MKAKAVVSYCKLKFVSSRLVNEVDLREHNHPIWFTSSVRFESTAYLLNINKWQSQW